MTLRLSFKVGARLTLMVGASVSLEHFSVCLNFFEFFLFCLISVLSLNIHDLFFSLFKLGAVLLGGILPCTP